MADIGKDKIEVTLQMAFEGRSGVEIAAHWGIERQPVNRFLKSDPAQARLADMRAEFDAEVGRLGAHAVGSALEFQVAVARGDYSTKKTPSWKRATIADRQRASDSIQDRYGRARGAKVEHSGAIATKPLDDAAALLEIQSMLELQQVEPLAIEGPADESEPVH